MAEPFANESTVVRTSPVESAKRSEVIAAILLKQTRDAVRLQMNNTNLSDEEVDNIIYMRKHSLESSLLSKPIPTGRTNALQKALNEQRVLYIKDIVSSNNALRLFGYSDLSDKAASRHPELVKRLEKNAQGDIALKVVMGASVIPGMLWLRGFSAPLYYGVNGALTGASAYDWYENGPNFWNVSGTLFGGIDLGLPVLNKSYTLFKDFRDGNIVRKIPISKDNYYRQVTLSAIDDANNSGVIRANPRSINSSGQLITDYAGASFTKGRLYNPRDKISSSVIVGQDDIEWVPKLAHEKTTIEDPDYFDIIKKRTLPINHGDEVTPIFNNSVNVAPSNKFYYWKKGNGLLGKYFWRRQNFDNTDYMYSTGLYFNKDKYTVNGNWNMPVISEELLQGVNNAKTYFNSTLRSLVDANNLQEARSLGFTNFDINRNAGLRVMLPLLSKLVGDKDVNWFARITSPGENPLNDQLEINLVSPDIKNSVFHEILHRGSLGIAEPRRFGESFETFRNRVKDTNAFYRKKVESFMKPRNEIPDNLKLSYDYVSEHHETGPNYFEAGLRLGIKEGAPYPGDDVVLKLIESSKTDPRMLGKGDLLSFSKTDSQSLLNLWKALTGTLFIFPLVYGTTIESSLSN